jgi:hypothetical protein
MPSYRRTPDDYVVIQHKAAALAYVDMADNFMLDNGAPAPAVPAGYITEYYDTDSRRRIASTGDSEAVISFGVAVPELEALIIKLPDLIAAQALREQVPVV